MNKKMRNGVQWRGGNGGSYHYAIWVRDSGTGKRRQVWKGGFLKRQEAVDARNEALVASNKGQLVMPRKQTLDAYLAEWLDGLHLKPKTIAGYRYNVDAYIVPALGAVSLQSLRQEHVRSFYAELAVRVGRKQQPLGSATRTSVHRTLRAALEAARRAGLIATNRLFVSAVGVGERLGMTRSG